jgi:predicted extracellular nuclease
LPAGPPESTRVSFGHTRTAAPATTGGDVHIASFNVLNYFPTTQEDPMQVLYQAGYTDIRHAEAPGGRPTSSTAWWARSTTSCPTSRRWTKQTMDMVTGAHVWNINSVEPVAPEYSRYNYNATDFYSDSPYRASDHGPLDVGVDTSARR